MVFTLDTKVEQVSRVGKSVASLLHRLGVTTVRDLLTHYPFRYDDFGQILPIAKLTPGAPATVLGKIELIENRRSPRRRVMLTEAVIADATGSIQAIWFNQPYLARVFAPGEEVAVAGQLSAEFNQLQFINPSMEKRSARMLHTGRLVPIYPTTGKLTQRQLRFLIGQALTVLPTLPDPMPAAARQRLQLAPLSWAVSQVHFPDRWDALRQAKRRLQFDELLLFHGTILRARRELRSRTAPVIPFHADQTKTFVTSLGFTLTTDQRKAAWNILRDLQRPTPMRRLLEGEVGAGKTVVVAIAALNVALAKAQTLVMAPTEILARQHYATFCRLFAGWRVAVGLLTRGQRELQPRAMAGDSPPPAGSCTKQRLLRAIREGQVDVVVGTHALLQEQVECPAVALAVVDEQHRFGVKQRQELKRGAGVVVPHFLTLTATPIPRSLALALYGELAISAIRQLPRERKPVLTRMVTPLGRPRIYQFLRREVAAGRQIFVVCPLIDPSDKLGVRAVTAEYEKLRQEVFPDLPVGLLHGKLSTERKVAVMAAFQKNRISLLVTTTVVEVGVDVPNASTIVIEGAERFGLSQLHQLRGRVGRAAHQSYCFLCTDTDAAGVYERLSAFLKAKDGFELAELDLRFRGHGELLGTEQSGFAGLRLANLADHELTARARAEAEHLLAADAKFTPHPLLGSVVDDEAGKFLHLE